MTYRYHLYCEGEHAEFFVLPGETLADKVEEVLYILYAMEQIDEDLYTVDGEVYEVVINEERGTVTVSMLED